MMIASSTMTRQCFQLRKNRKETKRSLFPSHVIQHIQNLFLIIYDVYRPKRELTKHIETFNPTTCNYR